MKNCLSNSSIFDGGPQDDKAIHSYWCGTSADCVTSGRCTTNMQPPIRRWEQEDVFERVQKRLDDPSKQAVRSMTVEHPFGKITPWKEGDALQDAALLH